MKLLAAASIALSAGTIILLLISIGHWAAAVLVAALALMWLSGLNRGWRWSYDAGFLALVVAAGWSSSRQTSPFWMLVAIVLALIGWDLSRFLARLGATAQGEWSRRVQNGHLRHLVMVLLVILATAAVGLTVQIRLNLGQSVLLGFVLVMSLAWLVRAARHEGMG